MELIFVLFIIAALAEWLRPSVPKKYTNRQPDDVHQYDVLHGGDGE